MHYQVTLPRPVLLACFVCRHCAAEVKGSPLHEFMFGKVEAKRTGGGFWREYGERPDWLQAYATAAGVRAVNNGLETHHRNLKAKFGHKKETVRVAGRWGTWGPGRRAG